MKPFAWRITVCLLPVIISIVIVSLAYHQYAQGHGGFRLGVDLAGGTILVYEVDETKAVQTGPDNRKYAPEELANALKKRIDPADLYNVTVRPIASAPGKPARVEIILPTGGRHQSEIDEANWRKLLEEAHQKYPSDVSFEDIPPGNKSALIERIRDTLPLPATPEEDLKQAAEISQFVNSKLNPEGGGKRSFSGEEVERIKNSIAQQGRLEFDILANTTDDRQAIDDARKQLNEKDLATQALRGEPPPPPMDRDGSPHVYTITVNDITSRVTYRWVELGKEELYSLQLNNAVGDGPAGAAKARWQAIADLRDRNGKVKDATYPYGNLLLYSRTIPDLNRLTPREREQGKKYEYFLLVRNPAIPEAETEVTGKFLTSATGGTSGRGGGLAVHFRFDNEGASRFGALTRQNRPSTTTRQLAVILDNQIRSAPNLNAVITSEGEITGEFTQRAIDDLVAILKAGALPASLKPQPVSENTIGATLGEDTIRKGTYAVLIAFVAVLAFMLVYYRFAGVVACVALLANLLLTVAFMVLVKAAFTLPGLAGLVLMLGMAVDANVLIYERLREERERGANLGLAIRNGYDRAFPTIIDTHLSSIFTAIVLFAVGNDQLKGFGISLTVGLIISLFTSLYMTRTMFDFCLAKHWLHDLRMMQLFRRPNIDFMAIRYYWFAATIALTIIGGALFLWRLDRADGRATVLNIDFTGGTAFTGVLNDKTDIDTLRNKLGSIDLPDLSVEQVFVSSEEFSSGNQSRLFTVRTSEKNADEVQRKISEKLGGDLQRVEVGTVTLAYQATTDKDLSLAELQTLGKPDSGLEHFTAEVQTVVLRSPARASDTHPTELQTQLKDKFRRLLKLNADRAIDYVDPKDKAKGLKLELTAPMEVDALVKKIEQAGVKDPEVSVPAGSVVTLWTSSPPNVVLEKSASFAKLATIDNKEVAQAEAKKPEISVQRARLYFVNAKAGPDGVKPDYVSAPVVEKVFDKFLGDSGGSDFSRSLTFTPLGHLKGGRFQSVEVHMPTREATESLNRIAKASEEFNEHLQPERLEVFDAQLASDTQTRALYAILASWAAILLYLWFRFGNWTFGAATVLCLIHDLFFTLGFIAIAHYAYATWFGKAFLIQDFKIDLPSIAALLTLVGYSVNDTIVVFDRIREVRGKSPRLTPAMINDSVNGTLSRTVLASLSVWLVVIVLYIFGGEGVHLFAYVMVVGVVVGTYSSIYIASPLLLIFGEGGGHSATLPPPGTTPAASGPVSTDIRR